MKTCKTEEGSVEQEIKLDQSTGFIYVTVASNSWLWGIAHKFPYDMKNTNSFLTFQITFVNTQQDTLVIYSSRT